MKFLLTSAGLKNETLADSLVDLVGKDPKDTKIAFIPTAAVIEEGNKDWVIDDFFSFSKYGFTYIDIVEISALSLEQIKTRLAPVDVICFGGGVEQYLMGQINKKDIGNSIKDLLKEKVFMGISAGSVITGNFLSRELEHKLFPEGEVYEGEIQDSLHFLNLTFAPHLNSRWFSNVTKDFFESIKEELPKPFYSTDDDTALKVVDGKIEIVGNGESIVFSG